MFITKVIFIFSLFQRDIIFSTIFFNLDLFYSSINTVFPSKANPYFQISSLEIYFISSSNASATIGLEVDSMGMPLKNDFFGLLPAVESASSFLYS